VRGWCGDKQSIAGIVVADPYFDQLDHSCRYMGAVL